MKLLRQSAIILIICCLGELIHSMFHLNVPGNVIGIVILFLCLVVGIVKVEQIEELSKFLLDHLAFFFVPAGVGILTCIPVLQGKWLAFLAVCIITTVIIITITGWTIQLYIRGTRKHE